MKSSNFVDSSKQMLMMDVRCNVMPVVEVGLESFFNLVHCSCNFVRCQTWLLTESGRLRWRTIHESSACQASAFCLEAASLGLTIGSAHSPVKILVTLQRLNTLMILLDQSV